MAASRDNATSFLRRLNGRETQGNEPGVYRWREIKEGQLAQIELDALRPKADDIAPAALASHQFEANKASALVGTPAALRSYLADTKRPLPCCDPAFPRAVAPHSSSNLGATRPPQSPPAAPAQTAVDASSGAALQFRRIDRLRA